MNRKSGLQLDVLSLFRRLLRVAGTRDPSGINGLREVVKVQFREKALNISRSDFKQIEHWLRYGHKQIKLLERTGFSKIATTSTTTANNNNSNNNNKNG